LFGAEQALRTMLNANLVPGARADHEYTLADLQAQMNQAGFAAAWAAGQAMSVEQAVAYAHETLALIAPAKSKEHAHSLIEPLSERELEVLRLVAVGMSNQEIAEKLFVTDGTIKRHTHQIFAKLGVRNRTEAVLRAKELELV
jgi:ATP/maltotriose-dependent transcriptional regulator MalT